MAKTAHQGTEVQMDMTPMIDVVFLMIIFFMIVTDLTQQDLAELTLPEAEMAVKDETPEGGRTIVNIKRDGTLEVKRQPLNSLDDPAAVQAVRTYLANEVLKHDEYDEQGLSERPLLIRCDKDVDFKYIQKLMQICGETGIQIYKIELAAAEAEAE